MGGNRGARNEKDRLGKAWKESRLASERGERESVGLAGWQAG